MDRKGAELKVGVAVILALVMLIGGIIWIKGCQVARREHVVRVAFDEVGGLTEGDPVTVYGVTKGSIRRVELGRTQVYVDISIDKGIQIPVDSEFVIRNIGLMGEKYVAVNLGRSSRLAGRGDMLRGRYESGVSDVVGEIGVVLKEFERTVVKVRDVMEQIEREEKVSGTLSNLKAITDDIRETVGENREGLRTAVEDLRFSSRRLKEFAQARGPEIDSTVTTISTVSRELESLVTRLESLSSSVEQLVAKVDKGEGTLGKLVNDDTLYLEMKTTLEEARALVADIKKNPKRYLKVSIF